VGSFSREAPPRRRSKFTVQRTRLESEQIFRPIHSQRLPVVNNLGLAWQKFRVIARNSGQRRRFEGKNQNSEHRRVTHKERKWSEFRPVCFDVTRLTLQSNSGPDPRIPVFRTKLILARQSSGFAPTIPKRQRRVVLYVGPILEFRSGKTSPGEARATAFVYPPGRRDKQEDCPGQERPSLLRSS
jgi:hypothetical protein